MNARAIPSSLKKLAAEMERELRKDILPFWPRFIDPAGGFYGQIENDGTVDPGAPKGLVMHARMLWTYAAAYRVLADPALLPTAEASFSFLMDRLHDHENRGFYWSVEPSGRVPEAERKVIYGQAFAIYALAEYARAGGPRRALDAALETYNLLENHAKDPGPGGYYEACSADWSRRIAAPLSRSDVSCDKSMNTNLHVMEALSSLYAATGDAGVREALRDQIRLHLERIFVSPEHLGLYFTADWKKLDSIVSFGHDIEASWLITEAAGNAWDGDMPRDVRDRALSVASGIASVLDQNHGSLPNELRDGRLEDERIWWVQAEALVGMVNAWELSGDSAFLERALSVWDFIKNSIIDGVHGEWLWGAHADGSPIKDLPKGGLWKAAYHDGRCCMEIMARAAKGAA